MEKSSMPIKDIMYEFLQNPIRENFTSLISGHTGEQNNIDFKSEVIKPNKLAQIILGMANTGGGVVIFGVTEDKNDGTTKSNGLNKFEDKNVLSRQIKKFLPENLKFDIHDFDYSGEDYSKLKDKKFQVLFVNKGEQYLPYICGKTGEDLKEGIVYVRRDTGTYPANQAEMLSILDKKMKSMSSTVSELELQEHINQLKVLYKNIEKEKTYYDLSGLAGLAGLVDMINKSVDSTTVENELYPEEDFESFIARLIKDKKLKIEKVLDLK